MKFVSKDLALKLKNKGFDKPCFGYYYIKTPTGMTDGELILNRYSCRGGTYKDTFEKHIGFINSNIVDAPTIEQVLKWLREEKDTYINIVPQKEFDYTCYNLSIIQFNSPKHNFDTFRMISFFSSITTNYDDVYIIGIKYVINNLI